MARWFEALRRLDAQSGICVRNLDAGPLGERTLGCLDDAHDLDTELRVERSAEPVRIERQKSSSSSASGSATAIRGETMSPVR